MVRIARMLFKAMIAEITEYKDTTVKIMRNRRLSNESDRHVDGNSSQKVWRLYMLEMTPMREY